MGLLSTSTDYLSDFVSLLFPNLCQACDTPLNRGEDTICLFCQYDLPQTKFHHEHDNPVAKLFWGRVEIEHASSFYYFHTKTKVQHLLHKLKYHGRKEIARKIGVIYGEQLKNTGGYNEIEYIIPVPLHKRRIKKRGYNQSDYFAMGLAESMGVEWTDKVLSRKTNTVTQTGKTRFERWNNVGTAFHLANTEKVKGAHLMLVDDVVTTGATLEACAKTLLHVPEVKVSIATIAWAH